MKLSVVIPVLNQIPLSKATYTLLRDTTHTLVDEVEFVIIDNGSDTPIEEVDFPGAKIVRNEQSTGVYPTFKQGFEESSGDVVAFLHSDLAVWEPNWNERVMDEFKRNARLGMAGFIGSNEIDPAGGRGLGTISNFQGRSLESWTGSPAHVHGKVSDGVSLAAVVDGCAMIIRREAWNQIGFREDFPIHHFYDRLISTQLLESGWTINVIGIACDHFSGQTVAHESSYHQVAEEWCRKHLPSGPWDITSGQVNWDSTIYQEAEKQWLGEYRDHKHIVPVII